MKFQFEIKNRAFFFAALAVSFVILLSLAIAITAPSPVGHTSNEVMISIGGVEKTLQSAIDNKEIGASIFKDGTDGIVKTQITGWAKINIAGNSYVVPIYNITESIVRVDTRGQTLEGHKLNYYLCTYDDFRSYTATNFCNAFGYSKGSNGKVECGSTLTQAVEYSHNGAWSSTLASQCSGQGLCSKYIVSIECLV